MLSGTKYANNVKYMSTEAVGWSSFFLLKFERLSWSAQRAFGVFLFVCFDR